MSAPYRGEFHVEATVGYEKETQDRPGFIRLRGYGVVDPDYDVDPPVLTFVRDRVSSATVTLSPRHIDNVKLLSFTCDQRFFSASISGDSNAVEVVFQPKGYYADAGPAHVAIHTDSERQPVVIVPLRVVAADSSNDRDTALEYP